MRDLQISKPARWVFLGVPRPRKSSLTASNVAGREPRLTAIHCRKRLLSKHLEKFETAAEAFSMKPKKHKSGGREWIFFTSQL